MGGDVHGTRTAQELVPDSNWMEDSMAHYLLLHLPGFEMEDIMVGLAYPGYVTISGETTVNDEKSMYFGQALKLPDNLDMDKIDQSFEDETLCLTFPKRMEKHENDNHLCTTADKHSQEGETDNGEDQREHEGDCHARATNEEQSKQSDDHDHVIHAHDEVRMLERAINLLKNRIVVTFVSAFSLGVLVSKWFEI
ncbi:hypothetical protein HRI_003667600 [Hibiscus trionum]|uniref:SHSP domain-containing protein n=1 Tax=Hibiscus trionum TaxID=183268 RepID=A0A9W7ITZ3_HIBTR|nr:hypothetical protein HRI_003667600 [Hibiscus trionum]